MYLCVQYLGIIIVIICMSGTKVITISITSNINSDAFDFASFVCIYFVYIFLCLL